MNGLKKGLLGWGAFILIAIGIANAGTPTNPSSSSVKVPQTSTVIQQQAPIAPATVVQPKVTKVAPVVTSPQSPVQEVKTPVKTYINTSGNTVQSPTYYNSQPAGATAKCRDGTYSFSQSRRGTCSHHGGVEEWL